MDVTRIHIKSLVTAAFAFKPVQTNFAIQNAFRPVAIPDEAYFAEPFDARSLDRLVSETRKSLTLTTYIL